MHMDGHKSKHLYEVPENLDSDRPLQSEPRVCDDLKIATHYETESGHISFDDRSLKFSSTGYSRDEKVFEDPNLVVPDDAGQISEDDLEMTDPVFFRRFITVGAAVFIVLAALGILYVILL